MEPTRAQIREGGYPLYPRDGSLLAHPLMKEPAFTGEATVVVERLPYFDKTGWADLCFREWRARLHDEFPEEPAGMARPHRARDHAGQRT